MTDDDILSMVEAIVEGELYREKAELEAIAIEARALQDPRYIDRLVIVDITVDDGTGPLIPRTMASMTDVWYFWQRVGAQVQEWIDEQGDR